MKFLKKDRNGRFIFISETDAYDVILMSKDEYTKLLEDIEFEKGLNVNLKRICKERACQKAGKPKNSLGYFVISSVQANEKYMREISFEMWKKENPNMPTNLYRSPIQYERIIWRTTIQTPHDASMPFSIAESLITGELHDHIFKDLGIEQIFKNDQNSIYPETISGTLKELKNIVYRWSFKADFKNGFWLFECYHTLPVYVPEKFRI